jgi:hypothetical protein
MLRMHNLHGTRPSPSEGSDDDEEDEDEEDEEEQKPQLELAMVPHYGGINRVRVQSFQGLVKDSLQHTPPPRSKCLSVPPPAPQLLSLPPHFQTFSLYELINR